LIEEKLNSNHIEFLVDTIIILFNTKGMSDLRTQLDEQFEKFEDIPEPKYPNSFLLHWVIDDMIGSNIFKNGKSAFTNLVTRNRHVIPGNIIIATQAIMKIPKTIRLNSNLIVLFKFANKKQVIDDIHPVVSAYVTEDQLMQLYEYATSEAHNALVIDGTSSKIIFKKNFDKILELNT
jgi:hypothetical protein